MHMVYRSSLLSPKLVSPTQMAELIEMPFVVCIRWGPRSPSREGVTVFVEDAHCNASFRQKYSDHLLSVLNIFRQQNFCTSFKPVFWN